MTKIVASKPCRYRVYKYMVFLIGQHIQKHLRRCSMASDKAHVTRWLLYEFEKGSTAAVARHRMRKVYGDVTFDNNVYR